MKALLWLLASGMVVSAVEPQQRTARGDDAKVSEAGGQEEVSAASAAGESEAKGQDSSAIPERFLKAYFESRPSRFLVDPQGLLGDKDGRDRESFLAYHAGDSGVDLFVFLFKGHQTIPSEVRHKEWVERQFAEGKPAVVVFYHLGAPEKSEMVVSPRLAESVSLVEQRRALVSSVEEAAENADALAQFEAFCVQLSIRIYWMERAAGLVADEPVVPAVRPPKSASVGPVESPVLVGARRWAERYGVPCGIIGSALAIAAGALFLARRQRRFQFPMFEVSPRLGGVHAAGVGAVISFGSAAESPSSQRNDVPDSLGL